MVLSWEFARPAILASGGLAPTAVVETDMASTGPRGSSQPPLLDPKRARIRVPLFTKKGVVLEEGARFAFL